MFGVGWPTLIAAVVVGVLSTGRIVRLVTYDDFPPSVWFRVAWANLTRHGAWSDIPGCLWCFSPYATAFTLGTAILTDLHGGWWLFNGWLAASYAVSMVVVRDEPEDTASG